MPCGLYTRHFTPRFNINRTLPYTVEDVPPPSYKQFYQEPNTHRSHTHKFRSPMSYSVEQNVYFSLFDLWEY